MIKRSIFIGLVVGLSFESMAAYSSPTMMSLDNDALSMVIGQGVNNMSAEDPYGLNLDVIRHQIQQFFAPASAQTATEATTFGKLFQVNEKGELWLSIQRNVVSIGTIECDMNFDGMKSLGNQLASEIKFY